MNLGSLIITSKIYLIRYSTIFLILIYWFPLLINSYKSMLYTLAVISILPYKFFRSFDPDLSIRGTDLDIFNKVNIFNIVSYLLERYTGNKN